MYSNDWSFYTGVKASMNKGKVRDTENLQYKKKLIDIILKYEGHMCAKRMRCLMKKTGKELKKIADQYE